MLNFRSIFTIIMLIFFTIGTFYILKNKTSYKFESRNVNIPTTTITKQSTTTNQQNSMGSTKQSPTTTPIKTSSTQENHLTKTLPKGLNLLSIPTQTATPPTQNDIIMITLANCVLNLDHNNWDKTKPVILSIISDKDIIFTIKSLGINQKITTSLKPFSLALEPQNQDLTFNITCNQNELSQTIQVR